MANGSHIPVDPLPPSQKRAYNFISAASGAVIIYIIYQIFFCSCF